MNTFQYNAREYVPSVDLTTLGNTFSTLEQGHKEAVQTASALQVEIGKLDMNEAEDGFKQQLVSEIDNEVKSNSIYGNAYGALDDLIIKSGKLMSDQRVVGRLRAQKDFKEYEAKVDAMAIPDGMKQMYKEENPYYYKDNVDEKTGKITGSKWEAKTNPVATVGRDKIAAYALSIAAKESGGGQSVSFLDENGKPTSDPSKSADGHMYMKTGSNWDRLSTDKIKKAYDIAINSIPGAKDSLKQDYKYALWDYNKNNKGGIVPGLTDKDGNIYDYDQWNKSQINGFANVAAYNNVHSTIEFGDALQQLRERQNKGVSGKGGNSYGSGSGSNDEGTVWDNKGLGVTEVGLEKVEKNAFSDALNNKNKANYNAFSIMAKCKGFERGDMNSVHDIIQMMKKEDKTITGPGSAANAFIAKYGKDLSAQDKQDLISSMVGYVQAQRTSVNMVKKAASSGGADALLFSNDVATQQYSSKNKYGKEIIDRLNDIYSNNKYVEFEIGSELMNTVLNQGKYGKVAEDLRKVGFDIVANDQGSYTVRIDSKHRNLLPKFQSLVEANKENNWWVDLKHGLGGNLGTRNFTIKYSDDSTHNGGKLIGVPTFGGYNHSMTLGKYYDNVLKTSKEAQEKVGNFTGYKSVTTTDFDNVASMEIEENHIGTFAEKTAKQKEAKERLDRLFASGTIQFNSIQYLDNGTKHWDNDKTKDADLATVLKKVYQNQSDTNKYAMRSVSFPSSTDMNEPARYVITFTVPKDCSVGDFKEGQTYTVRVGGNIEEATNLKLSYNPSNLANNAITTANSTNSDVYTIGTIHGLGNTDLHQGYKKTVDEFGNKITIPVYKSSVFGKNISLTANDAHEYATQMYKLEQFKPMYIQLINELNTKKALGTLTQYDLNTFEQYKANASFISQEIARITGVHVDTVENGVLSYILN